MNSDPLRVALVALYPVPGMKAPGGVRAVAQSLVRGLQEFDDLQVCVIHCHADIPASATTNDGRAQIFYIAMPKKRVVPNMLASIPRVERLLRQVQPHVVSTHAAHYTVAALRSGLPTVFTIHGVVRREARVYTATLFDRARFLMDRLLERYAVGHVSDIVAISPYVLEEYRRLSSARFHRIDNPLAPEFFSIPNLVRKNQLLYAGTIDERKNVLDLLRALVIVRQGIPSVRLRIAGRTTSPLYAEKVRQFVAAEGLEPSVDFLGLLDRQQMLQEYAHCCLAVLASRQETAPMAVLEAMAASKPVIAMRVGGVSDLVEDGGSGFTVAQGDVQGLASHVVYLLNNEALRQRLGQRGRQLAERFRLETVAAQYRQLYYHVAGRAMP